jgi:hypothetical protein
MKAAVLQGKRKFTIEEVPEPVLDKDEVLIKVRYCGICGSDLHVFNEGAGMSHRSLCSLVMLSSTACSIVILHKEEGQRILRRDGSHYATSGKLT